MKIRNIFLFLFLIKIYSCLASESEIIHQPIDIVYTWVDGNDPEWQKIKNFYLSIALKKMMKSETDLSEFNLLRKIILLVDSATDNRFVENEELRYSLRSVLKYASFFNHIYIVTMGQTPKWLLAHPKITIVDHKDIFKDINNLPTFNSQSIESNLHRIANLSERFIYFNDDIFLGDFVKPEDFFVKKSVNVLFERGLSPTGDPLQGESAYRRAWRNTNAFLDKHFKVERRRRICHAPLALRKSYIEKFDAAHPEIFESNSTHKFRSDDDYNVTNGLLQYYWMYDKKVIIKKFNEKPEKNNIMISLQNDDNLIQNQEKLNKLKEFRPITFCIEDDIDGNGILTKTLMRDFLNEYYPEPAPWEKFENKTSILNN